MWYDAVVSQPRQQRIYPRVCLLLASLLLPAVAVAHPRQDGGYFRTEPAAHHKDDVHYKYQYAVDDPVSGVVNDRWEQRHGDFVKGQYSLLDPDGKVRTVDYEVDGERGFHAVIRTQYPAPSLLSIQSASNVLEVYQDSPVNIRAKAGLGVPEFALQNPRFSVRDNLPFNYHALDASKIGIDTQDDGAQLQYLEEGPLSAKELQRRKYHRENHLLPHEQFLQQHQLDQSIQQDTRLDVHHASFVAEPNVDVDYSGARLVPSSVDHVFNPRAEYINLRHRPRPLSPLPPPNPAVASTAPPPVVDVLLAQAHLRRGGAQHARPAAPPAFLFQPNSLQTLALLPDPQRAQQQRFARTSRTSSPSKSSSGARIVQHLTETSPGVAGVSANRNYFL